MTIFYVSILILIFGIDCFNKGFFAKLSSSQVELRLAVLSLSGYQVGFVFTYLGMYTYLFQKLGM